jgi:NADH-quinone oxidoreductase subunit N
MEPIVHTFASGADWLFSPVVFALLPFLILGFGAMLVMLAEVLSKSKGSLALPSAAVLAASGLSAFALWIYGVEPGSTEALAPWLTIDRFTLYFEMMLCLGGALAALLAGGYLPEHHMDRGEFYPLLMFGTFGAMMLAASGDALTLFLGLETMSIGAYAMTAFRRGSPRATEGALKYYLLGSFAAALMLYGLALLYGATGHTDLVGIGAAVSKAGNQAPLVLVGFVLVLVGLVFKVSAVPFHMWTPDAYEGAPTPATTFMAVLVKAAAFAMMLRVLLTAFNSPEMASWGAGWPPALAAIAVATMTVANLIAGRQESIKRMLAYSSIAHAGYILVGVVATMRSAPEAGASVMFYLLTYSVSTVGAFGALILAGSRGAEAVTYEDFAGLGRRHPAVALAFSFFLLSLAGIPPTAGFFGKWFVLRSAIDGGFYWLAIIAFLNSVVGVYYYLRVLVYMYMREPAAGAPVARPMQSSYVSLALIVSAVLVVVLGTMPGMSLDMALSAALGAKG